MATKIYAPYYEIKLFVRENTLGIKYANFFQEEYYKFT